MKTQRNSERYQGRKFKAQQVTLTSGASWSRGQKPSPSDIRKALNCLYKTAAHMERDESYAGLIARECPSFARRSDFLRAALVLIFKNASEVTVWDAVEYLLVPLIRGLCEGLRETGNILGTGMTGADGREHLLELTRDEGDPLQRIIDAIARHCPQDLYGHPESSNE